LPWALLLLAILVGYVTAKKLNEVRKKAVKIDVREKAKTLMSTDLVLILFLSFVTIMFGNSESWVVPSFIVGVVAIVLLLVLKELQSRSKKN
jgi:di/tricarboxylate transporter